MTLTQRGGDDARSALRVLIVDDDRDAADSLHAPLQLAGHDCRTAYGVHAALAEVEDFRPHVVLLSSGMFRNNFHVVGELCKRGPVARLFIIAALGHADPEQRGTSERPGFGLYMVEPLEPEELIGLLVTLAPPRKPSSRPQCRLRPS